MHERAYKIRVEGLISPRWLQLFDDLNVDTGKGECPNATTTLTGTMPDQAALIGLLQMLYTLGLPLLLVESQEEDCLPASGPARTSVMNGPDAGPERTKEEST
jgi:hypothetical protein